MSDSEDLQNTRPTITPRLWLKGLAQQERRRLIGAAFCGVISGVLTVIIVVGIAWLVDQLIVQNSTPAKQAPLFIGLAVAVGLRALLQWGHEVLGVEASLRIRQKARAELLSQIAMLGPVWLTQRQSGALANQAVEHIEALEGYFARFYPQLRIVVVLPLIIVCVVAKLDYLVAIFLLLAAPLIPLFMALVGIGAERLNQDQFAAVARLSAHFVDRVRGITTLQLFGYTKPAQQGVWYATDRYRQLSMRTLRLAFLSSAVLEFFSSVAIAVIAMYVGFGLLGYIEYGPSPALTLFTGLAVLLLAPEFFQPLRTLSQHYHDRAAALGAAESIVVILNQPAVIAPNTLKPLSRDVVCELEGVSVAYPGYQPVLKNVDIKILQGDVVAITGESGSGKSSLLALMAGFMAPREGDLRREVVEVAWLDQAPCIIHGSLADNLRLANPEASEEAMKHALQHAGLGEVLRALPNGLESHIGERGIGLSGGQAQRLALARIYISTAPLLLLDEPTANLDAATEELVIKALLDWVNEGRTLVIATHHPAVVSVADRHLVCSDERLEEVSL